MQYCVPFSLRLSVLDLESVCKCGCAILCCNVLFYKYRGQLNRLSSVCIVVHVVPFVDLGKDPSLAVEDESSGLMRLRDIVWSSN